MHGFSGGLALVVIAALGCQARAPDDGDHRASAPGAVSAGRHLSSDQVSALRTAFDAVPRDVQVEFRALGGDIEAVAFMQDFGRAWPEGRGEVTYAVETSPSGYPSTAGVLVCVQEKPGRAFAAARALHAAMIRSVIATLDSSICLVDSRRWGGGENVVVFVGTAPSRRG
jgi:hypothetical protein